MIRFDHVTCGYGSTTILKNINLSITEHSITSIIGRNGSGKSTLLKSLVGLSDISGGAIYLNNHSIDNLKRKTLAKQISYLSQQHTIPSLSVERLVLHGRFPYTCYPRSYTKNDFLRCEQAMEQTDILKYRSRNVNSLSGGERQKVYLAMCLATDADIFLFDEPTTYLDLNYQLELLNTMKELKQQQKTVITVLHDLGAALSLSDMIVVMDHGSIVSVDSPTNLVEGKLIDGVFGIHVRKFIDSSNHTHYYFEKT